MSEDSYTYASDTNNSLSFADLETAYRSIAGFQKELIKECMGMNVIVSPHVPEGMAFLIQREALSLPKPEIMYPPYVDDREDLYRVHWDALPPQAEAFNIFSFSAIADVAEAESDYRLQAIIGWAIIFVLLILFLWWGWM